MRKIETRGKLNERERKTRKEGERGIKETIIMENKEKRKQRKKKKNPK